VAFDVRFDVLEIAALRDKLTQLDDARIQGVVSKSITEVAQRTYANMVPRMTARVNLSDADVRERMVVTPVKLQPKGLLEASIVAPASQKSGVIKVNPVSTLRRFAPRQETTAVKWPNARIADKIGKLGVHPTKPGAFLPWKARTGDPLRAIPIDMKANGVSVEVLRGSRKRIATAFLIPLNRGAERGGNGLGVVQRQGGKIKTLKGPSVFQVMRGLVPEIEDEVGRDLRETTERNLSDAINEVLSK
jgi:hypothetical protein